MSYSPRHRPRATSAEAVITASRRRRPSRWLMAAAALGIAAALANAFPDELALAVASLRGLAAQDAPLTGSAAAPPSLPPVPSPSPAPAAPVTAPVPPTPVPARTEPAAPMTVIQVIPPPQPEPYRVVRERPAGTAGSETRAAVTPSPDVIVVEALRSGTLRLATSSDLAAWKSRNGEAGRTFDERTRYMKAYVITRDFEIPDGLSGAHAALFLVQPGAPHPHGSQGHSPILDMRSGACVGGICPMLMRED